jgi:sodium pump decarboxylase gamma subunit
MNVNDLVYGLIICMFGMGVVFAVLIGLSFITRSLKFFSNTSRKENNSGITQVDEELKPAEVGASEIEGEPKAEELAAVITAAVAICMGRENNLVVRSIRRVEDYTPVWGKVSRQEQMLSRF